jgi:hypothetical protein
MTGTIYSIGIAVSLVLGFLGKGSSPDITNDLVKMNTAYRNAKFVTMQVNVKMALSKTSKPIYGKGVLKKGEEIFYSSIMGKQVIANKKYVVMIDEKNKVILVKNRSLKKDEGLDLMTQLDSTWLVATKAHYLANTPKEKKIGFDAKSSGYNRCEIVLDGQSNLLKQIFFEYMNATVSGMYQMQVDYTTDMQTKVTEKNCAECRLEKYVRIKGTKIQADEKYKNYTVYDKRR